MRNSSKPAKLRPPGRHIKWCHNRVCLERECRLAFCESRRTRFVLFGNMRCHAYWRRNDWLDEVSFRKPSTERGMGWMGELERSGVLRLVRLGNTKVWRV